MIDKILKGAANIQTRAAGAKAALFGAGGIKAKLGLTAGYLGAAGISNAYISYVSDMKRGYYGDSRYQSYYGDGAANLSSLITFGGGALALGALMGRDPISRARGTYRYWIGSGGRSGRSMLKDSGISAATKAKISATPKFGFPQLLTYGSLLAGAPGAEHPEYVLGAAGLMGIGALIGGASKVSGLPVAGFAASVGAVGIGGYIGYRNTTRNPNPAAEGNITSFNENSVVSKMNWSTAGLVQALHRNRKVGV